MQTYPVKPGHAATYELDELMKQEFGAVDLDDDWYKSSFGSLVRVWAKKEGKRFLIVDTETDKSVASAMAANDPDAMETAMSTQRAWNNFLLGATGYPAKIRSKKLQEMAKKQA